MMVMMQTIECGSDLNRKALEKILLQAAAGEKDALELLYHQTRAAVYGMALSILKNPHDAQDVAQDTFVRVWECAPQYCAKGAPMVWILTITRNLALTKLRRDGRHVEFDEAQWEAIPADAPNVTPEDRYLLQMALGTLSDEECQIVMLHALTGLKHREIAALLEMPLATVLSKYHRALKKLRDFMKGDDAL